jgi:hypothetical protein
MFTAFTFILLLTENEAEMIYVGCRLTLGTRMRFTPTYGSPFKTRPTASFFPLF